MIQTEDKLRVSQGKGDGCFATSLESDGRVRSTGTMSRHGQGRPAGYRIRLKFILQKFPFEFNENDY
jgi:hypothetical protein